MIREPPKSPLFPNTTLFPSLLCLSTLMAIAQMYRTVQNRPYTDLRPFHFGVLLGTHLQDIEFTNVGLQTITNEDGTTSEALIDRKSTRLNSSHANITYAVFC